MAQRVCDVKPCEEMAKAGRQCFALLLGERGEGHLIVEVKKKKTRSVQVVERLSFKYCPFCGTRITQGVVDFLKN